MALVQKNGGSVNLNASIATSLGSATTAGNTILIFANGSGTISTPSGFVSRSPQVAAQGLYLFEKLVASGNSSDTPTLTMSGAYNATWQIAEYANISAFDTSSGNNASAAANPWATPSITPASGNKRLIAFVAVTTNVSNTFAAGDPQSWGNGFTGQQSTTRTGTGSPAGNDSMVGGWADNLVAANGSTAYSSSAGCTTTGTFNPASIIAAYTTSDAPPAGIAFRSLSSTTYASRTNTTVTAPTGIANNDILIAAIFTGGASPPTPTFPTGFTAIDNTSVSDTGGFIGKFYVAWKRAASESGSYVFTHTAASSQAFISAYSACAASGSPIDTYSKNFATGNQSNPTTTATGITTSVANTQLLYVAHDWTGSGTLTPPTGFTERFDSLVYTADSANASAGATGNVTQTHGTASDEWSAFLIALLPATGGGPTTNPQSVNATSATTTSFVKSAGKLLALTSTSTTTFQKAVGKAVAVTSDTTSLVKKAVAKAISLTSATTTTALAQRAFLKTVAAVSTTTTTLSRTIGFARLISATSATTTTLKRAVSKTVALTSATTTSLAKSVAKKVTLVSASVVSTGASFIAKAGSVFNQTVAATSATTTTVKKSVGKPIAVVSTTTTALLKRVGKPIAVLLVTTTSTLKSVAKKLTLTCASTTTAVGHKVLTFLKTVVATCSTSSLVSRVFQKFVPVLLSDLLALYKPKTYPTLKQDPSTYILAELQKISKFMEQHVEVTKDLEQRLTDGGL
jgi:hypothetical protein